MKKILILFFLIPIIVLAEPKLERSTVNTGGGEYKGNNINISYSIGEIAVESKSTPTIILTQGFQQPDTLNGVDVRFDQPNIGVKVFPNPAGYKLTIEFPDNNTSEIIYALIDIKGETIIEGKLIGVKTQEIDLSKFTNGTYYLIIRMDQEVQKIKVMKLE
jgi:hypothetical protein